MLASGHRSSDTLDTALEIRNRLLCPVGNDRDTIRGSDERALAVDHVPVTITIRRGTKLDILAFHVLHELVRVRKVRVGVASTKVGEWDGVLDGGRRQAELVDENSTAVWAGDTVHTIEEDLELVRVGEEEGLDEVKVKDRLEELDVVLD